MTRPVVLLVILLLLFPTALISYRVLALGYPLFPAAPAETWQISMDARLVEAAEGVIDVTVGLPYTREQLVVLEEHFTSGTLSFDLLREGSNRLGVWSGPILGDMEIIAYRAIIVLRGGYSPEVLLSPMLEPFPASVGAEERALAERLVAKWGQLVPIKRLRAIAATAKGKWGTPQPTSQDLQAWSGFREKHGDVEALRVLLRAAGLPYRGRNIRIVVPESGSE